MSVCYLTEIIILLVKVTVASAHFNVLTFGALKKNFFVSYYYC